MKLRGKVVFRDVETGVWVLEADDGRVLQLAGGDRKLKRDGALVEVEGELAPSTLSLAMVGPLFTVRTYRFV